MADSLISPDPKLSTSAAPFPRPPRRLSSYFAPATIILALVFALITFMALTGTIRLPSAFPPAYLLLTNVAITFILAVVVGWEVWGVLRAQRKGRAGANLHSRVMLLFAVIATVPAILVAVVAVVTQDRALERVFSRDARAIIESASSVAITYAQEYAEAVAADTIAFAKELSRLKRTFETDRDEFRKRSKAASVFSECTGSRDYPR